MPQWKEITNDPTILQWVNGVKIEFRQGLIPFQCYVRPSVFNQTQHAIVTEEIDKLLEKGELQVYLEPWEFISPIFLRPKQDGSRRMILNLKTFNEFVQNYHFKIDLRISHSNDGGKLLHGIDRVTGCVLHCTSCSRAPEIPQILIQWYTLSVYTFT